MAEKREIALTTDDRDVGFKEVRRRREAGEVGWDMAKVRDMTDPPHTTHIWCVFRKIDSEEA